MNKEAKVKSTGEKEFTLPSGRTAVIKPFKGKHVREAQRLAGDDAGLIVFAMIAITTTIDGQAIIMEDMDEMDGPDCLALMGEFSGNFSPANN